MREIRTIENYPSTHEEPYNLRVSTGINTTDQIIFNVLKNDNPNEYIEGGILEYKGKLFYIDDIVETRDKDGRDILEITAQHTAMNLGKINNVEKKYEDWETKAIFVDLLEKAHWGVGETDLTPAHFSSFSTKKETDILHNILELAEQIGAYLIFQRDTVDIWLDSREEFLIQDSKNLLSIKLNSSMNNVITRLYVIGGTKTTQDESGSIQEEVTIAPVNLGKDYIEDYSYYLNQGYSLDYIKENPIQFLKEDTYRNTAITDPEELYQVGLNQLQKVNSPNLTCSIELVEDEEEQINLNMYASIFDSQSNIRLNCIITKIERTYEEKLTTKITLASVVSYGSWSKKIITAVKKVNQLNNEFDMSFTQILNQAKEEAYNMIHGGMELGNVVISNNSILIGDTNDFNTMTRYWIWSMGGFGFVDKSKDENRVDVALTADGKINGQMLLANSVKAEAIEAESIQAEHLSVGAKNELYQGIVIGSANYIKNSGDFSGTKYWLGECNVNTKNGLDCVGRVENITNINIESNQSYILSASLVPSNDIQLSEDNMILDCVVRQNLDLEKINKSLYKLTRNTNLYSTKSKKEIIKQLKANDIISVSGVEDGFISITSQHGTGFIEGRRLSSIGTPVSNEDFILTQREEVIEEEKAIVVNNTTYQSLYNSFCITDIQYNFNVNSLSLSLDNGKSFPIQSTNYSDSVAIFDLENIPSGIYKCKIVARDLEDNLFTTNTFILTIVGEVIEEDVFSEIGIAPPYELKKGELVRVSVKFTVGNLNKTGYTINPYINIANSYELKNMQWEKGNILSDWHGNFEDIEEATYSSVEASLTVENNAIKERVAKIEKDYVNNFDLSSFVENSTKEINSTLQQAVADINAITDNLDIATLRERMTQIEKDNLEITARYNNIYNNNLTPEDAKNRLFEGANSYKTAYENLVKEIEDSFDDGVVTEQEKEKIVEKFTAYKNSIGTLSVALDDTLRIIAEQGAIKYANEKISELNVTLEGIEGRVSSATTDFSSYKTRTDERIGALEVRDDSIVTTVTNKVTETLYPELNSLVYNLIPNGDFSKGQEHWYLGVVPNVDEVEGVVLDIPNYEILRSSPSDLAVEVWKVYNGYVLGLLGYYNQSWAIIGGEGGVVGYLKRDYITEVRTEALVSVGSDGLLVRSTPGGAKLGTVYDGTVLPVLENQGDWIKVRWNNREGYVYKQHTKVTSLATVGNILDYREVYNNGVFLGQVRNGEWHTLLGEQGIYYKIDYFGSVGYVEKAWVSHTAFTQVQRTPSYELRPHFAGRDKSAMSIFVKNGVLYLDSEYVECEPYNSYTVSFDGLKERNVGYCEISVLFYDKDKNFISNNYLVEISSENMQSYAKTFITSENVRFFRIRIVNYGMAVDDGTYIFLVLDKIMVSKGQYAREFTSSCLSEKALNVEQALKSEYVTKSEMTQTATNTIFEYVGSSTNMIEDGGFESGSLSFNNSGGSYTQFLGSIDNVGTLDGGLCMHISGNTKDGYANLWDRHFLLEGGKTYTISCVARGNSYYNKGTGSSCYITDEYAGGGTYIHIFQDYAQTGNSWKYYKTTFTAPHTSWYNLRLGWRANDNSEETKYGWGAWDRVMLVEGKVDMNYNMGNGYYDTRLSLGKDGIKMEFEDGSYMYAGRNGLRHYRNGWDREYNYVSLVYERPKIKNGATTTLYLPEDFQGKNINSDFTVVATYGDIDSDVDAEKRKDSIRKIFVKIISWDSNTRALTVQPCLQKLGGATLTYWGWNAETTDEGNAIGEGAIDIIVHVNM